MEKKNNRRWETLEGESVYNFRSGVPRGFEGRPQGSEGVRCDTSWERMFQAERTANVKTQRHVRAFRGRDTPRA